MPVPEAPPTPDPFVSPAWGVPTNLNGQLAAWLDQCEADLVHPAVVEDRLKRAGWPPAAVGSAGSQYRRRFAEHSLGYTALLVTTGVVALAAGTAGHLLTAGLVRPVDRNAFAVWLTVLICALPFAAWSHVWARRVDRTDPVAVWSGPRRLLALTLLWAAAIVGGIRLLVYGAQLIGVLVGATWAANASLAEGAINVSITVAIALPLALWAYGFLHRFDAENPTTPAVRRRAVDGRDPRRP
jgi:hypothetical protein